MLYLGIVFFPWHLFYFDVLWTSWICSLLSDINFGKILSHDCFRYFFCPFLSLVFSFSYITPFGAFPELFDVLFCFFFFLQSLFFLLFSFRGFYWDIFSLKFLVLTMSSLLISPSKAFFISVTVFLISTICCLLFFRVFISLLTLSLCSCMLSTLSIRALSTLIIVVLYSYFIIPASLPYLVSVLAFLFR